MTATVPGYSSHSGYVWNSTNHKPTQIGPTSTASTPKANGEPKQKQTGANKSPTNELTIGTDSSSKADSKVGVANQFEGVRYHLQPSHIMAVRESVIKEFVSANSLEKLIAFYKSRLAGLY
jgi:hypothetical protein